MKAFLSFLKEETDSETLKRIERAHDDSHGEFYVLRIGTRPTLENANAGDLNGIASFLCSDAQDMTAEGGNIHLFKIKNATPGRFIEYQPMRHGKPFGWANYQAEKNHTVAVHSPGIGRQEKSMRGGFKLHWYSFGKTGDGWTTHLVHSVVIKPEWKLGYIDDEVHTALTIYKHLFPGGESALRNLAA